MKLPDVFDARNIDAVDALKGLKERLTEYQSGNSLIEVLVCDKKTALRIRAFSLMSGFNAELKNEAGHYRLCILPGSCCCFR